MNKLALVLAAIFLFLPVPQPVMAATTSGSGEIDGSIINGTAGGSVPDALSINLTVYQNDIVIDTRNTLSTTDGKFTFTGLPTDSTYSFFATAVYQQIPYTTDQFSFDSGQITTSVQLPVYETTTQNVPVSVMMSHAILNYTSGSLQVKEYDFFVNTGDRTYLGLAVDAASGRRETLKLSLPAGATGVQVDPNLPDYLTASGTDLSYSAPLIPGANPVIFSYSIPCNSDSFTLARKVNYDVSRFDLVILNEGVKVSGSKFTQEESLNISGTLYQDYSSQNLNAGDNLTAQISGLLGGKSRSAVWFWWLLIPAAAIVVLLVLRQKKKVQPVNPSDEIPAETEEATSDQKQKLLREIAALDDQFEDGLIEETEYRKLRAAKKQKLLEMNGN